MATKKSATDVDALLDGDTGTGTAAAAAPAKKAKGKPAAAAAPAKKAKGKPAAAAAPAKKAKAKKSAAPAEEKAAPDSAVRRALAKVRKATSYAAFSEANGFNIRTVRRTARAMRDAGEIELSRDGQTVYISPAV